MCQGVPTLWGSFEVKNVRLLKRMMQQHCGRPLDRINKQDFLGLCGPFSELPMYFLKFFGSTDVHKVRSLWMRGLVVVVAFVVRMRAIVPLWKAVGHKVDAPPPPPNTTCTSLCVPPPLPNNTHTHAHILRYWTRWTTRCT